MRLSVRALSIFKTRAAKKYKQRCQQELNGWSMSTFLGNFLAAGFEPRTLIYQPCLFLIIIIIIVFFTFFSGIWIAFGSSCSDANQHGVRGCLRDYPLLTVQKYGSATSLDGNRELFFNYLLTYFFR